MKSNDIMADARMMHLRELKSALACAKARLSKAEAERDLLVSHFGLALVALRDFERMPADGTLRIVDGWNAVLRLRNVSRLSAERISALKKEYLGGLGVEQPSGSGGGAGEGGLPPVGTWIVFDGEVANSFRSGPFRVTYTGGTGLHRADKMILDFVNAARVLGLDVSRIMVETSDKDLARRLTAAGAKIAD